MVNINIKLDDELHMEVKIMACKQCQTIKDFVIKTLKEKTNA